MSTSPVTAEMDRPTLDVGGITAKTTPNIFDRAIAVNLEMGMLGHSKKLAANQYEVDADKTFTSASKRVVDCKELRLVANLQGGIRERIKNISLPSLFKSGVYLIPIPLIGTVDADLRAAKTEIQTAVDAFLAVYPEMIEKDRESLRGVFNIADYPPIAKVTKAFYMDWSYISFGVPESLQNVDSELFQREQQKAADRLNQAADQIEQVLRAQMLDLVGFLAAKLTGNRDNGKPKVFRDTAVENVKGFLATFRARNITDDKELEKLCDQAEALLNGVDPQALRDSEQTRAKVAAGFSEIKEKLGSMMVNRPGRAIQLMADPDLPPAEEAPEPAPELTPSESLTRIDQIIAQASVEDNSITDDDVPF